MRSGAGPARRGGTYGRTRPAGPPYGRPMAHERFPGWRVVAASFTCLTVTAGLGFYGLAVYLTALSDERGWSVGTISGAVAVFFLVSGVAGLGVARLLARLDVRAVVLVGAVIGALALLGLGQVREVWQVYLVYAVLAVGHTFAGLVPATTVVTRWFHLKRSTALSIASTGLSVGGVLITPVAKWSLDEHRLAGTAPWLAAVWVVGIVPVTLLLMRPDPARLGWEPDGGRVTAASVAVAPTGTPFATAVRSRFFVVVTVAYFLVLGSQVGGIQQLVKLVEERLGSGSAAGATSALAGASIVARLVGGQVAARTSMLRVTIVLAATQGLALGVLSIADSALLLFGAIVLFGATVGNLLMLQPLLMGERFGVRDYPRIFSRSQFFTLLGTAVGPYALGALHDHAGGYRTSYVVAGAGSLAGALVLRTADRPGGPAGGVARSGE